MADPPLAGSANLLALQRAAGNRAVTRLADASRPSPRIQARRRVGAAGDAYEQEAERVAGRVLGMGEPAAHQGADGLQRQEEEEVQAARVPTWREAEEEKAAASRAADPLGSFDAGPGFEAKLQNNRGRGEPLPHDVQSDMEHRFGANFSGVRLHSGPEAAALNRTVSARAFTYGQDIYMGAGQADFGASAGKHLLAHELTHVVQQGGAATQVSAAPAPVIRRYFEGVNLEDERGVEAYIRQKLKDWSGLFSIRKARRRVKGTELMRDAPEAYKDLVHRLYQEKFGELIEEELPEKALPPERVTSDESAKEAKAVELQGYQRQLQAMQAMMKEGEVPRDYEDTIDDICQAVPCPNPRTGQKTMDIEGDMVAPIQVIGPHERVSAGFAGVTKQGKAEIDRHLAAGLKASAKTDSMAELGARGKATAKAGREGASANAEFDLSGFAGLALRNKSEAEIQHHLLGSVQGDILTLLKLGAGGKLSGSAEAALSGLKAQVLADAWVGGKLDVTANARVGNDLVAFGAGGGIHGMAGAAANVGLSAALGKEGFEAALKAGAFAGATIEFSGTLDVKLGKRRWGSVSGGARFSAGAGGNVEGTVSIGPSGFKVKFSADATLGLGTGFTNEFSIDLKNIGLSIRDARTNLTNFYTTQIQGYQDLDAEVADKLKVVEDVLWYVNKELGAASKRQLKIRQGRGEKLPLL